MSDTESIKEEKTEEETEEKTEEKTEETEELEIVVVNEKYKYTGYFIVFMFFLMLIFPFIFNSLFCANTLSKIITGNLILFATIIPLTTVALFLLFLMDMKFVIIIFAIYYYLIYRKWCLSSISFVVLVIIYAILFYFANKVSNFINKISVLLDDKDLEKK